MTTQSGKTSKKRSRNYTTSETELLLELAGKKKKILSGRLSATLTSDKKKRIWVEIAKEVNGINGKNDRTPKDLKKKWQNLVNTAKTKERQNKETRRKTGGGPSEEQPLSAVEQMALQNVSAVQVEGINGGFEANRSILVDLVTELDSPLSSNSPIIDLSGIDDPHADRGSTGLNGQDLVDTIGEGLRAVYGNVAVNENDEDYDYQNGDDITLPPDSPAMGHATRHSLDLFDEDFAMNQPDASTQAANPDFSPPVNASSPAARLASPPQAVPSTQVAQPACTSAQAAAVGQPQPVTLGPIRSNRTVTRDIRRTEFKELLQRKDKLNELLSNTNSILGEILNELKRRA
jgi:hypothetical protein